MAQSKVNSAAAGLLALTATAAKDAYDGPSDDVAKAAQNAVVGRCAALLDLTAGDKALVIDHTELATSREFAKLGLAKEDILVANYNDELVPAMQAAEVATIIKGDAHVLVHTHVPFGLRAAVLDLCCAPSSLVVHGIVPAVMVRLAAREDATKPCLLTVTVCRRDGSDFFKVEDATEQVPALVAKNAACFGLRAFSIYTLAYRGSMYHAQFLLCHPTMAEADSLALRLSEAAAEAEAACSNMVKDHCHYLTFRRGGGPCDAACSVCRAGLPASYWHCKRCAFAACAACCASSAFEVEYVLTGIVAARPVAKAGRHAALDDAWEYQVEWESGEMTWVAGACMERDPATRALMTELRTAAAVSVESVAKTRVTGAKRKHGEDGTEPDAKRADVTTNPCDAGGCP